MTDGRARRREEGRTELYNAAVACYEQGDPIEVAKLAADLGISRASAYRWVGSNDRLLAEVLRVRIRDGFRQYENLHRSKTGADRVAAVLESMIREVLGSRRFHALLTREPVKVLEITASRAYPNQRNFISLVQGLLEEEIHRGYLAMPIDSHTMAYSLVRLAEAFVYGDIVAGERPDVDRCMEIIRLLLGA